MASRASAASPTPDTSRRRPPRARLAAVVLLALAALTACLPGPGRRWDQGHLRPDPSPYLGLGTWVDAFDFVPAYQTDGRAPEVSAQSVATMAEVGVKTLYLQAAREDDLGRSPGLTEDPALLDPIIEAAHARGIKVVAWYLPKFEDLERDFAHLQALFDYRTRNGQSFDGLGVDIEFRRVADHAVRSRRLVDLSRRVRAYVGTATLSAIVVPPVVMDVINPNFWPTFPWTELGALYDVWQPMAYWTQRRADSGYRDGYRYTHENIQRIRNHLGRPDAAVHPVGGIADAATDEHIAGMVAAAKELGALGWSLYDWRTTRLTSYPVLRG